APDELIDVGHRFEGNLAYDFGKPLPIQMLAERPLPRFWRDSTESAEKIAPAEALRFRQPIDMGCHGRRIGQFVESILERRCDFGLRNGINQMAESVGDNTIW